MSEVSEALAALKTAFQALDPSPSTGLDAVFNYPTDAVNVNAGKILILRHAKEIQTQFRHGAFGVSEHIWWCEGLIGLHKFPNNQAPPPYPATDETTAELLVPDYLEAIRTVLSANITLALAGGTVQLGNGETLFDYISDRFFWNTSEFFGIRFLFQVEQESVVTIGG